MNKEQLFDNLKLILIMEYYGIRMEDTKDIGDVTYYYVSVPESSVIEITDHAWNDKIKTADGLVSIAKDMFVKMTLDSCKAVFDDDEFVDEVKANISDYIKVFAKVRKGEVWTEKMAEARLKEFGAEIREAKEYKEV